MPAISLYFVIQNRDRLAVAGRRVYWPGLILLFLGLFSFAWCIYPVRNDMLQGYSMIVALMGLVLFLLGPGVVRVLWFPILYLALGVKVSEKYWNDIAWQLQLIAAKSATVVIQCLQIDARVKGSTIELMLMRGGQWVVEKINVAEACSGLRMLMSFIALGAAMAYLADRSLWKRVLIFALAVPIALVVNIGRVTVVALLSLVDKDMASGDFHIFVGMLMLIPAAGLFMLVGWVLDRVVIEEGEDPHAHVGQMDEKPVSPVLRATGPTEAHWTGMMKGLITGTVLTAMIGLEYGLLLAISRPDDLFGGHLSSGLATGLAVGGVVMLALGFWIVLRLVGPESQINHGPSSVSLSLTLGVLLTSVLGLNGVVQATRTVLIKQPVPLRVPLYRIPTKVNHWEMVSEDPRLSKEMLEELGTTHYISRVYKDTSWQGAGSKARLHIVYYTGTPDTVPHVPDRCYVGAGMNRIGKELTSLRLAGPRLRRADDGWVSPSILNPQGVSLPQADIQATIFTFSDPRYPDRLSNAVYFFAANGDYFSTPEWVRARGFDPRDRYSYYCKIEVGVGEGDLRMASERVASFLSVMLPEIMACLPDWNDVTAGRWPEKRDATN